MKNILITGGSGFIGSAICLMLVQKGYNVTVFDDNSRGNIKKFTKISNIKIIIGDIRIKRDLSNACKKIDTVIHLAAVNGTKYFYEKPHTVLEVAAKGVINIIDVCIQKKIKNLFLASSSEVYHFPKRIPTDEKEPIKIPDIMNPRFSYAGGKIFTELMGINYGKKFFKKLIIFRPHNVYGKNMGNEHVIPELIDRMKKFKSGNFYIKGTGNETRAFIHIDDFVKAFEILMKKGKHLNIYNIGTDEMVSINHLSKAIAKIFSKKIKIKNKPIAIGGTKMRCPDIKKIRKLGFKNYSSLEEGLQKVIF
jgi:nucleoside-diphosphate-sugar epimerase